MAAYAEEVRHVDDLVGRLVRALPGDTRWVIASDHGESLLEHGYPMNHGRHVFQATVRVPVVVVGPDVPVARDDAPVPSWLVGPTVLRLAGLPHGPDLVDHARSSWADPIVSFTTGQESRPAFGLGPQRPELAWREGADKAIVRPERRWRFDLALDPDEAQPHLADHPAAQALFDQLTGADPAPRSADDREWLEALGYVE